MKTLYLRHFTLFGWYLSDKEHLGDENALYFRGTSKSLFDSTPTWFGTKETARKAAEEMGFKVVEMEMVEKKAE
jgi:hypothetical protein